MIEFIKTHIDDFLAIIGAIVSVASLIVKLTPTQKDDAFLEKVVSFLNHFSVFNPNGTTTVHEK